MFQETGLAESLQSIPWFHDLSARSFERLCGVAVLRVLKANEVLFREGERAAEFFILLEGKINEEARVPYHGCLTVFTAEPLDAIGWESLTTFARQRIGSAYAATDCRVIVFDGEILRRLSEEDHDLGYVINRRLGNIIASRMLTTRLHLYDLLAQGSK